MENDRTMSLTRSTTTAPTFQTGEELCNLELEEELKPNEKKNENELNDLYEMTVTHVQGNRKIDRNMAYTSEFPLYAADLISMKNRELYERTKNSAWNRHLDFDSAVTTLDCMLKIIDRKFEFVKKDVKNCYDVLERGEVLEETQITEEIPEEEKKKKKRKKKRKRNLKFFGIECKKTCVNFGESIQSIPSLDMRTIRSIDYGSIDGLLQYKCKWKKLLYGNRLIVTDHHLLNDIPEIDNRRIKSSHLLDILQRTSIDEEKYLNFYQKILRDFHGKIVRSKHFTISTLIDSFNVSGTNDISIDDFYLYEEKEIGSDSCSIASKISSIPSQLYHQQFDDDDDDDNDYDDGDHHMEEMDFHSNQISFVEENNSILRDHISAINLTLDDSSRQIIPNGSIEQILTECANDIFCDDEVKLKRLYCLKRMKQKSNLRDKRSEPKIVKQKKKDIFILEQLTNCKCLSNDRLLKVRDEPRKWKRRILKKKSIKQYLDDDYNIDFMEIHYMNRLFEDLMKIPDRSTFNDNEDVQIKHEYPETSFNDEHYPENDIISDGGNDDGNEMYDLQENVMATDNISRTSEITTIDNNLNEQLNDNCSFPLLDIPKPLFEPINIKLDYRKQANRVSVKKVNKQLYPIIQEELDVNESVSLRNIFGRYSSFQLHNNSHFTPHSLFLSLLHLAHEHKFHVYNQMMGMETIISKRKKSNHGLLIPNSQISNF
ncbi:hypothetical protein SNEBB_011310 [Seison nebaliae]|nr:hypothetical protein SNEBB_011310 [Seison nebaliae]